MLEIESALLLCALVYIIAEQTHCIRVNFAALANSALRRASDCDQEIRKCPRILPALDVFCSCFMPNQARRLYYFIYIREIVDGARTLSIELIFFIRVVEFLRRRKMLARID